MSPPVPRRRGHTSWLTRHGLEKTGRRHAHDPARGDINLRTHRARERHQQGLALAGLVSALDVQLAARHRAEFMSAPANTARAESMEGCPLA